MVKRTKQPVLRDRAPSFDDLLMVLGNQTRRRILQRILSETHYPLQLARELGISQQAVAKHLRVLEHSHLVVVSEERSDAGGPPRKSYHAAGTYSMSITVGPRLFDAKLSQLQEPDSVPARRPDRGAEEGPAEAEISPYDAEYRQVLLIQNHKDRVRTLLTLVARIDRDLQRLGTQQGHLLEAKQRATREASAVIGELYRDYRDRAVLYKILEKAGLSGRELARELDLREKEVEAVLERLIHDNVISAPSRGSRRR